MFELLAESKPMHVLELPHRADDADALEHWTAEVRKLQQALEARFGVSITDEKLREAIRLMNRERGLRRQLADLMTREHPPLTGRQLLDFKSLISGIEADLRQDERSVEMVGNGAAGRRCEGVAKFTGTGASCPGRPLTPALSPTGGEHAVGFAAAGAMG